MQRAFLTLSVVAVLSSAAWASFFDIYAQSLEQSGPPYPTSPVTFQVTKDGGATPVEGVDFDYSLSVNRPTHVVASDQAGGGGGGRIGVMNLYFNSSSSGNCTVDSFFDIYAQSFEEGTVTGSSGTYADSFFDIFVELTVPGAGEEEVHVHGQANQSATFDPNLTGRNMHTDSFFDIFTELTIPGGFDPQSPVMTTTIQITPEPTTLGLLIMGGLAMLRRKR